MQKKIFNIKKKISNFKKNVSSSGSLQPCQLQELLSGLQNCLQTTRGDNPK